MTLTNPTQCGLPPWHTVGPLLDNADAATYAPAPLGLLEARQAVADHLNGAVVPAHVVLTASTSEAYSWIFKLLCNAGDEVLVPAPSYPLFGFLAGLEGVVVRHYVSVYAGGEWQVDTAALGEAVHSRVRAIVVVAPSNPTGSVLRMAELAAVEALCAHNGIALICNEVFAQTCGIYGAWPADGVRSVAGRSTCLTFALGGLSKACLLPQLKCAWIGMSGPAADLDSALAKLEIIADTYLSVGAPAQVALAQLLAMSTGVQANLHQRLTQNKNVLQIAIYDKPMTILPCFGGWSAVLRLPLGIDEELAALSLLDHAGVAVHPGNLYDFADHGHWVIILLPEPDAFAAGVAGLRQAALSWATDDAHD